MGFLTDLLPSIATEPQCISNKTSDWPTYPSQRHVGLEQNDLVSVLNLKRVQLRKTAYRIIQRHRLSPRIVRISHCGYQQRLSASNHGIHLEVDLRVSRHLCIVAALLFKMNEKPLEMQNGI